MKYWAKEPSRLEVYLFAKMPPTSFPLYNYYFILERHFTECRNLGCLDNPRLDISPSSPSRVTLPVIPLVLPYCIPDYVRVSLLDTL